MQPFDPLRSVNQPGGESVMGKKLLRQFMTRISAFPGVIGIIGIIFGTLRLFSEH